MNRFPSHNIIDVCCSQEAEVLIIVAVNDAMSRTCIQAGPGPYAPLCSLTFVNCH